jgi:hypothetical protein
VVKSFGFVGGKCPEGILSLAMVGNKLWSGLSDGALRLWDGKRGRMDGGRRKVFKIGVKKIIGVKGGKFIVVAGFGWMKVFSNKRGVLLKEINLGENSSVYSLEAGV